MFDLNYIVGDDQLYLDFVEVSENELNAVDKLTGQVKGKITINGCTFDASSDKVFLQYKLWLTRPERAVGKKVEIDLRDMEGMIEQYEELLIGAYIITSKVPAAAAKYSYSAMINWLRSTDFYKAPASTQYHESFEGGLLVHSLKVYNAALDLTKADPFKDISLAELTIGALVHDWCKIGEYEVYQKNVKNEVTGTWEKVNAYKHNPKGITLGHGVTSLYLAGKCFNLSSELAAAIRWHQGRWNCCREEMNELQNMNEKYPLVHLIQFADQIAITKYTQGGIA